MRFKNIISHFQFNRQERSGIFFLIGIILLIQIGYIVIRFFYKDNATQELIVDKALEKQVLLLQQEEQEKKQHLWTFNPNYITDEKGYRLGMSVDEIDRLLAFRATKKFVNSAKEFQAVTHISDSLLLEISPLFKFPDWVDSNLTKKETLKVYEPKTTEKIAIEDINTVSEQQLQQVSGIGAVLGKRIIAYRSSLGGFRAMEQLYDVYGLDSIVVARAMKDFSVLSQNEQLYSINKATIAELNMVPGISYDIAWEIVNYRTLNGNFTALDDLKNIEGFPVDKIERIKLYLML